MLSVGQPEPALAAPHADYSDGVRIPPMHDSERRMDDLPQERLVELRDDAAELGMVRQCFDAVDDPCNETNANLGNSLIRVPRLDILEIGHGRFRDA